MSEQHTRMTELDTLLAAAIDGRLTDADRARLAALLAESADAREYYVEYIVLHATLRWQHSPPLGSTEPRKTEVGGGAANVVGDVQPSTFIIHPSDASPYALPVIVDVSPTLQSPLFTLHSPIGNFLFSYLVGAVLLGISLLIGWTWRIHYDQQVVQHAPRQGSVFDESEMEPRSVGRITGLVDCQWAKWSVVSRQWSVVSESEIPNPKPQISNQELLVTLGAKYNLTSGFMEITYDAGAKVILQGPCTYEVESAAGGFLSLGKLTARVERGSKGERTANLALSKDETGPTTSLAPRPSPPISNHSALSRLPSPLFSVRTPTVVVTDLGTEFGVEVTADQRNQVSVFEGQVELQTTGSANASLQRRVLTRGQSAVVDDHAVVVQSSLSPQPQAAEVRFVRRMPRARRFGAIDLRDVMFGGASSSGQTRAAGRGGLVPLPNLNFQDHEYHYHPIPSNPMIDGVFILPRDGSGPVQLDSVGHTFDGFSKPSGIAAGAVGAGAADAQRDGHAANEGNAAGISPQFTPQGRGVLMPPVNQGVTFDLAAICKAQAKVVRPIRFRALVGVGPPKGLADFWVFVNGRSKYHRAGLTRQDGAIQVNVELKSNDRFLTLVSVNQSDAPERRGDWLLLGEPSLHVALEPGEPQAEQRSAGKEGSSMN